MGKIADLARNMHREGASVLTIIDAIELAEDAAGRRQRKKSEKDARATRLKRDWHPPLNDFRDATDWIGFDAAHRELERFRDYWVAQPGQKGVKLDWNATWRNWIRTAAERQNKGASRGQNIASAIDRQFVRGDGADRPRLGHSQEADGRPTYEDLISSG